MPIRASKSDLLSVIWVSFDRLTADPARDTLMSPADLVDYLIGWNELKAFARRYSAEQEGKLDMHPDSARRRHG